MRNSFRQIEIERKEYLSILNGLLKTPAWYREFTGSSIGNTHYADECMYPSKDASCPVLRKIAETKYADIDMGDGDYVKSISTIIWRYFLCYEAKDA